MVSANSKKKITTVLVCGGGNAAHVLATVLGSKPDHFQVHILTLYADEADRWTRTLRDNDFKMKAYIRERESYLEGTPTLITNDPETTVPNADWIILALPSTLHGLYMKVVAEHCNADAPLKIGALSPHGGFDLGVRAAFKESNKKMEHVTLFGTYELPWACRVKDFGREVAILGIKQSMTLVVSPPVPVQAQAQAEDEGLIDEVINGLQDILQVYDIRLPKLLYSPGASFLPLMLSISFMHGTIIYGQFKDWDGVTAFDEKPLFYQGVTDETVVHMTDISDEIALIKLRIVERYPAVDLSCVLPLREWILRSYGNVLKDKDHGLGAMLRTNPAYDGLVHPMRSARPFTPTPVSQTSTHQEASSYTMDISKEKNGEGLSSTSGGWVPDWTHRYMVEDLFFGIINIRAMGELVQVNTPRTDQVIAFCERVTKAELIVDGKLKGKDVIHTRTPQRYGYHDLDTLMKEHYPSLL